MALPWKLGIIFLFRTNGKTLLIDYQNYPHPIHQGFYSPCGGKFDREKGDLTLEDTAKREPKEETGIIPRKLIRRGTVYFINERRTVLGKPMKYNFKVEYYDCLDFDDSDTKATEGKLEWVSDSEVPKIKMHEGDLAVWDWLQKYNTFEGIIEQEGTRLIRAELLYTSNVI